MNGYRARIVDQIVQDALATFGAVIIQGPRAVGKTTTGLQVAASSMRLDSSPVIAALTETSPDGPHSRSRWARSESERRSHGPEPYRQSVVRREPVGQGNVPDFGVTRVVPLRDRLLGLQGPL